MGKCFNVSLLKQQKPRAKSFSTVILYEGKINSNFALALQLLFAWCLSLVQRFNGPIALTRSIWHSLGTKMWKEEKSNLRLSMSHPPFVALLHPHPLYILLLDGWCHCVCVCVWSFVKKLILSSGWMSLGCYSWTKKSFKSLSLSLNSFWPSHKLITARVAVTSSSNCLFLSDACHFGCPVASTQLHTSN